MFKVLWNGRSGLAANQNRLDLISNNIANVNTNGYKTVDASFEDIYYANMNRLGLPVTNSNETLVNGSGVKADKMVANFKQGVFQQTDKESDLAIEGEGFFKLVDPSGNSYYTRDGSFSIDAKGNFVHSSGLILSISDYKPEELKSPISIDSKGNIYSNNNKIGKIDLTDFKSKDSLLASGQNLFQYTGNSEDMLTSNANLVQGFTERSNVDITTEMTDMLITQRAFELNSKTIQAADQMWQIANNLRNR
jgi:flagellar basal-body rod protein FlgG